MSAPEVSVVIPTYNRCELLHRVILSVLKQTPKMIAFEIVVVDNNSTDETSRVIESLITAGHDNIKYVLESRQGNAYARNTGIEHAKAPLIAFLDDDVCAGDTWLKTIVQTFSAYPDLTFIGGRVLPVWDVTPASWLTSQHWSPIAAVDYGNNPLQISGSLSLCLLTANIAFRREVFKRAGGFSLALQRVKDGIGSMEDHEFLSRICRSGERGMYVPQLIVTTQITPERLTKRYHRRWHTGHGRFFAIMRDPEWERSQKLRLLDVPAHVYRQTALDAVGWLRSILLGKFDQAFLYERQLRFFIGFFIQRQKDLLGLGKQK